jgi:hypothetical protein
MIITNEFIWLHFGKTGGDMFHYLMNKYYSDKIVFQHKTTDPNKHQNITFVKQKHIKNNTKYLMGFRKLPSWILSHNKHHLRKKYKDIGVEKYLINATKENKLIIHSKKTDFKPDDMLKDISENLNIKNINFIRQEYLLRDSYNILGTFYGYNENILLEEEMKNKNFVNFDCCLSNDDIIYLYKNNPTWASLENQIYASHSI